MLRSWAIALFIAFGGWVVMSLWNWLLPGLFGWRMITFWQAMAMLVLCRILFGGCERPRLAPLPLLRPSHRRALGRHEPEEREKFREGMRAKWASARMRAKATKPELCAHPLSKRREGGGLKQANKVLAPVVSSGEASAGAPLKLR